MAIAVFTKNDRISAIDLPANIQIGKTFNTDLLHRISGLSKMEIERRFLEQNDAWVLWVDSIPVAFGWAARCFAPIGELERFVRVKGDEVYLWNFRTAAAWRGRGFYPMLLQKIIESEIKIGTQKIWIIAKPENKSSYKGIIRAGFQVAGEIAFNASNELVLLPVQRGERADEAAEFLNIPIAETSIKPCWCCNSNNMAHAKGECSCMCNTDGEELCIC
jgi:GNAT superfamily N-acetyltransferase